MALDEVQRVPDLLLAVKAEIDEQRQPGRFLLTGSANGLTLPLAPGRCSNSLTWHEGLGFRTAQPAITSACSEPYSW